MPGELLPWAGPIATMGAACIAVLGVGVTALVTSSNVHKNAEAQLRLQHRLKLLEDGNEACVAVTNEAYAGLQALAAIFGASRVDSPIDPNLLQASFRVRDGLRRASVPLPPELVPPFEKLLASYEQIEEAVATRQNGAFDRVSTFRKTDIPTWLSEVRGWRKAQWKLTE
jgi:hypothetical protein